MKKLFALLLTMMMVFALAACGGNEETPSGSGTTDPGTSQQPSGSSVINAADEAWVGSATKVAYIFLADGKYESYKQKDDGTWSANGNGTYKIDRTSLTLDSTAYPFAIDGDTLTLTISGSPYEYTRTSPFTPGGSGGSTTPEPGTTSGEVFDFKVGIDGVPAEWQKGIGKELYGMEVAATGSDFSTGYLQKFGSVSVDDYAKLIAYFDTLTCTDKQDGVYNCDWGQLQISHNADGSEVTASWYVK